MPVSGNGLGNSSGNGLGNGSARGLREWGFGRDTYRGAQRMPGIMPALGNGLRNSLGSGSGNDLGNGSGRELREWGFRRGLMQWLGE